MKNINDFSDVSPKPCEPIEIKEPKIKYINIEGNMKNLVDGITDWKTTIPAIVTGANWVCGKIWGFQLPQSEVNIVCIALIGLFVNTKK
jgi:hypothetical protein